MQNCVTSIFRAPITYITQLGKKQSNTIMMRGTSFYPAFIISIIFGYIVMLALATYFIYFFIVNGQIGCLQNVRIAIIILACLYPIQSTVIFICLIGSAGTSQTNCWKFFISIFYGLFVSGLGFGGIGMVYICILSQQYPLSLNLSFATNQSFIITVVYLYLSFIVLYLILVPLLTCTYDRQNQQYNNRTSCCDTCCCIFYYFLQFIFFLSILVVFFLKLMGPVILIYDLIEVGRAHLANSSTQTAYYALSIIAIFGSFIIFIVIYIVSHFCCKNQAGQVRQADSLQTEMTQASKDNNSVFLTNKDGKNFQDEQYTLGNKKL